MGGTCAKCGNPLAEASWQCDICGAVVQPDDASFVARHPLLRRLQEAGVAVMTVVLGLGLGLAIIVAIQLNKVPAAAQTVTPNGTPTVTPLFGPAIVSSTPPPGPSQPADPKFAARNLLGQASHAMADLRGYEAAGSISNGSGASYSVAAAIVPPDRLSLTIGTAGGIPGAQQYIIFSGFTLYTSSDGQTWRTDNSGMGTALRIALASLWSGFDAKAITDPAAVQLIGDENVGSTVTTHLTTDFASIAKAHSLLLAAGDLSKYKGSVDVWVSKSDHTIRRFKADITDGSTRYLVDVTFSNFNGDVKVEQPAPLSFTNAKQSFGRT